MAASQPCVSCRAPLPLGARFCNECGTSQPLGAVPAAIAPPAAPPPSAPQKIGLKTVVGVAAPSAAEMAEAARSMGIRPQPQPTQPRPMPAPQPSAQPLVAPPATAPAPGVPRKPLNATMIGVATPGVPVEMTRAAKSNVPKGTLVGVALPGIAPTHPQTPPVAPAPAPPAYPPVMAPPPAFAPPPSYGAPSYPPAQPSPQPEYAPPPAFDPAVLDEVAPAPKRSGRGLAIALVLLALLGTGAAVFFLFLRPSSGPPALSGTVRTKDGAQSLVVQCDTCEDGATIDLGKDKTGEFAGKKATLPLGEDALKAGKNTFAGEIVAKKGQKPQKISLEVVVPFLVKASLAPLGEGEPAVELQFDLAPDVKKVTVEGKKIEGDKHRVALDPVTTEGKTLAKKIAYAVDGTEGTVELSIPVAPLRLALPGRRALVAGEAFVSGRTAPGAFVTVGTTKLTADKDGVFKGKVTVTEATLTVVAFGGKLAPRAATVSGLVIAKDLAEAQKALKAEAKTKLDDVVKAPDASAGQLVSGRVKILTTLEEDGRGVAVAETLCAKAGDESPCPVVRLLLPAGAQLQKNDLVDVVGVVVRAVPIDKGKATATELDAALVEKP